MPDGDGPMDGGGPADGGVDADPEEPNPFPSDPKGGEFAWVVSAPGAGDTVEVAVDPQGNIFVAATQTGAVTLGNVHVPAPAGGRGLVVLKLTADGEPIWGRSVASAPNINARAIAVTLAGDVVVGGALRTSTSYGSQDGFLMVLDGDDGTTRWTESLASSSEDHVAGIAVGPDATGTDAIYVYGELGRDAVLDGHAFQRGAYLVRYDDEGTRHWAQSFPRLDPGFDDSLALDPQRGPVITGRFSGDLRLGDRVLTAESDGYQAEDAVVAGFAPDGRVRFARQIFSEYTSYSHNVAVAPGGDIYLASETSGTETVVDDHTIPIPDLVDDLFLLRLTPEGRYASSTVLAGRRPAYPHHVATDAAGAAYLVGTCEGQVDVQPAITCAGQGGIVVSYGADNEYQWASYVTPAFLEAIAPAPGNRLIVAGQALSGMVDFGGIHAPVQTLFIAALAGGPARLPSPLPAAPAISSLRLDGINDREIRQGGTATLVIEGAGLDKVTRARLGDLDVHIPAGAGMAGELRLPLMIPHGHTPGWLDLTLGNAGGSTLAAAAVRVTPLVVSPTGSDSGRGTLTSPLRLCTPDLFLLLRYGDTLLLRNGVHTCDKGIYLRPGVIVRGESKTGAIVRGFGTGSGAFGGFGGLGGRLGTTAIEDMTIESADLAAITLFDRGRIAVTDVDVRGVSASGIWIEGGGIATVSRYRYQQSPATAIVIFGGRVDARQVHASGAYRGVLMTSGTLNLADSSLSSDESAVEAGSQNHHAGARAVTISNTTLRSRWQHGLTAAAARLTVTGSTIEPLADATGSDGVFVLGGVLTLADTIVRGWAGIGVRAEPVFPDIAWAPSTKLEDTVHLTLDHTSITACAFGVYYLASWSDSSGDGELHLRRSHVSTNAAAVTLLGAFAAADLGTAASPGDNQLQVISGSALRDGRTKPGVTVDAHGTTLNGMTFDGSVLGPVNVQGAYVISGPNEIRF